jgi:hypothetical protein
MNGFAEKPLADLACINILRASTVSQPCRFCVALLPDRPASFGINRRVRALIST